MQKLLQSKHKIKKFRSKVMIKRTSENERRKENLSLELGLAQKFNKSKSSG